MECFIKKIFMGKADGQVHNQFTRFGKGVYSGRAAISLWKTGRIKLSGSYEYANDFVSLASEFDVKFSGLIFSRESLDLGNEKKKSGLFSYEVSNLAREKIKEIKDKAYYMLLDAEGEVSLKMKKKLPKPGKSGEAKIDDKFCVLEADLKFWPKVKEAFCWDADGKKIKIRHTYNIEEIIIPGNEKNPEEMRLKARRKGILVRKIEVDGREEEKKINFEV